MAHLKTLNQDEFINKVVQSERPVVLEFGAGWCGSCKMLTAILAELAQDYAGRVDFFSVDVNQNPDLVMAWDVMSVPTLILFKNGHPVERVTGYLPKNSLEKVLLADL